MAFGEVIGQIFNTIPRHPLQPDVDPWRSAKEIAAAELATKDVGAASNSGGVGGRGAAKMQAARAGAKGPKGRGQGADQR